MLTVVIQASDNRSLAVLLFLSSMGACTTGETAPSPSAIAEPPLTAPPDPPAAPADPPPATGRREFEAGKLPGAIELAASYMLDHLHQDMMHYTTSNYDMNVRLAIEADGHASFSLTGTVTSGTVELMPSGESSSTPRREYPIDETWTGAARMLDGELIVRFDNSTAYQPPLEVDVEWICEATTLAVAEQKADVKAWQCATSQSATKPNGPAHSLDKHLQIPIMLATPNERLRVDAHARGGADNRSTISNATYSRAP